MARLSWHRSGTIFTTPCKHAADYGMESMQSISTIKYGMRALLLRALPPETRAGWRDDFLVVEGCCGVLEQESGGSRGWTSTFAALRSWGWYVSSLIELQNHVCP